MGKKLEFYMAFTASTVFDTINKCYLIRNYHKFNFLSNHWQYLETQIYLNQYKVLDLFQPSLCSTFSLMP